jgi:hypothetical protein
MNDLDTHLLRRALRARQEPGYPSPGRTGPADVAEIITRGRRLRWRRRAMAAGGSVCLAAAVVGAVAGIGRLTAPSPGPSQHVVSPVRHARSTLAPSPSPGRGRATPSPVPSATAVPTASPTPSTLPTATSTPPRTLPTPSPTRTPGAAVSASGGYSATSTPSASAGVASTDGEQPSATPSAAG